MAVLTIGLSCYDQFFFIPDYPVEDHKIFSTEFLESGGGPCGNASYLLGLWGINVYHITSLKNDIYGTYIISELNSVNVNIEYSIINHDQITPLSTILINEKNKSRTIITNKSNKTKKICNSDRNRLQLLIDKLNKDKGVHIILIDGHEYELSEFIIPKISNKIVVMDAGNLRESNLKLAKYTDYFIASEHFAQDLINEKNMLLRKNQILALKMIEEISAPENTPIITLGEYGVISLENKEICHYSAYDCVPVDTTGAGDIFHGAFVFGLCQKWDLERVIYFSNLASAISIEKKGVRHILPSLAEVQNSKLSLKPQLK
ncbi:MAG: PfkB family carbohydrate kinase [[Pasteurella] mairii]|uniref:Fructokinase n=1 Tax=[Pasteurella] mairii TaxID=757 RepID=A0A379B1U4_9PAST|nr:PfkB family carbohydrate kinase [[Pasteurella] mairii]SUB32481.1 fructokinase [[Pasteurella] mairii]